MFIGSLIAIDEVNPQIKFQDEINKEINNYKTYSVNENKQKIVPSFNSIIPNSNPIMNLGPFDPIVNWIPGGITSNPCGGDTTFSATLWAKGLTATSCELFFVWDVDSHLLWQFYDYQTPQEYYDGNCPYTFSISDTGFNRGTWYYTRAVATNNLDLSSQSFFELSFCPGYPSVLTNSASEYNYTSICLNGNLNNGGFCGTTCDVWFVYDTVSHSNPSEYAYSTSHQIKTSNGVYDESVSGLSIGTQYYYRACASNDVSSVFGDEQNFLTWGAYFIWEDSDGDGQGTNINFNASNSCGDNSIVSYQWDWTNDGTYDFSSDNPCCNHDYFDTYPHDCKLKITNIYGQTDTIINSVKAKVAITADAAGPYFGFVNTSIQFIGSASGGTPPYNWNWDFGDGNSSNEQYPIHTYSSANFYTIILSVTDNYDGIGLDSTSADIQPIGGNHRPIATDDNSTVDEDSVNNRIDVLANDYDPDSDNIFIASVTTPSHGTIVFNSAYIYYTPDSNYNGPDSFYYNISDELGGNDTAYVDIQVLPQNDNPTANDDATTVTENTSNNEIDVLLNDYDIDGDDIQIIDITLPSHGMASYTPDYVYYTPDSGYLDSDSFTYFIGDGKNGTDSALILITIKPVEPDLKCVGEINWVRKTPGTTVYGNFTVENIGDPKSYLDWAISEYPGWGNWMFSPASGEDLTPENGATRVQVEVVVPNKSFQEYSDNIKIINLNNNSDYSIISVSLSTPTEQKSAQYQIYFFLEKIFERFPLAFPILRHLMGY
jgi:PKD repeat protein